MLRIIALCSCLAVLGAVEIRVPAGIDHAPWTTLLQRYVDGPGLVAYAELAAHAEARERLDAYLAQFAERSTDSASGAARHAALINFYNAITIREVIRLEIGREGSYWRHDPFDDREHRLGGVQVSLDDVEHRALRPEAGYRIHAAVVCAARSCPPLWREAYTADNLDRALDERFALWLERDDLNRFHPDERRVELSKIFDWFEEDFEAAGGIRAVLLRHAPERHRDWLRAADDLEVDHLDYDKTLNAQ